jgi:cellulose synthase (UDP-forming)
MEGTPGAGTDPWKRRQAAIIAAVLAVFALPLVYSAIVVPLSPWEQGEVSLILLGLAMLASSVRRLRPLIVFLSCFASMRYFYWRVSSTFNADSAADATVSALLLGAEIYGLAILYLGYFQTIELRSRTPPPVPDALPTVDVFIPTYNESVEIVRRTAIGALAIDYPRKQVFILDDGRRPEIARMAGELGCFYLTRPDNAHAKAGNLNHALARTHGDLIAFFDADHVPVCSFLRDTVGFFEDEKLALVQTAQHFFNPDPYERNLKLAGRIAPEQAFFYHVVQAGNDFWNSAFFCGSCAVMRRAALQEIGGVQTATVTEDAHTALVLHARGWRSAFLSTPLAAGLATETFAAHVTQRMRWARGMAQILRLDCPLFKRGLSLPQRLNYFNAMAHFFFGIPRLIMILGPLSYLLFGIHPLRADVPAVLAYILPHIGLCTLANSMISERYRHSFWASVYEVSIASYTAGVTLMALVNPRLGTFNVTEKGTSLEQARFDHRTVRGPLLLLGLSLLGLMVALPLRLVLFDPRSMAPAELHATLINGVWVLANLATLVASVCVAYEQPQQRRAPRVARGFACALDAGEDLGWGRSVDISESGVRIAFPEARALPDECRIALTSALGAVSVRARRRWCEEGPAGGMEAGLQFVGIDAATQRRLVELIFTGEQSWALPSHPRDDPFRSLAYLLTTFWRVTEPRRPRRRQTPRVRGRWSCIAFGQEGVCLVASATGGLVELAAPPPAGDPVTVRIAVGDQAFETRGRVVSRHGPNRVAVAFAWSDPRGMLALGRALYGPPARAVPSPESLVRRAHAGGR